MGCIGPGGKRGSSKSVNTHLHLFVARKVGDRWYLIDPYGIYGKTYLGGRPEASTCHLIDSNFPLRPIFLPQVLRAVDTPARRDGSPTVAVDTHPPSRVPGHGTRELSPMTRQSKMAWSRACLCFINNARALIHDRH